MSIETNSSELQGTGLPGLESTRPARLGTVCTNFVVIEFLCVAVSAYLAQMAYEYVAYSEFDRTAGLPAALALATLVCGISFAFRQFIGVQRQPLHTLLWNGIGAVALAFSCFLSSLFVLRLMNDYSHGSLCLPGSGRWLHCLRGPYWVLCLAAVGYTRRHS